MKHDMIKVYSLRKQKYIEEHGIMPVFERPNVCWYELNNDLAAVLDRYFIEVECFRKPD